MAEFLAPAAIGRQVVMKQEATAGTDVFADTYLAADVQQVDADSIRVTNDPNEIKNLVTMGNLGQAPSLKGPRVSRIDFRIPIRGNDAGIFFDDTPEIVPFGDRALQACALGRTFASPGIGGSTILYKPSSTQKTYTIYVTQPIPGGANCLSRQFTGCSGTFRVSGRAGEGMSYEFSMLGSFEEEKDIVFVPGTMILVPQYPQLISAAFQIGSANYAPRISTVTFDAGQRVGRLPSINAVTGVAGFRILQREPSLVIDPEVDLDASSGWWAAFRDGAPLKDCTFILGGTALNRLTFRFASDGVAANLQVVDHQLDSRDDLSCFRITLRPTIAAGNDDWGLLYS